MVIALTLSTTVMSQSLDESPSSQLDSFVDHMVTKHQFDGQILKALLSKTTLQENVLAAIQKPYEALPWYRYRAIFLKPERAQAGAEFWKKHQAILSRAEKEYGVPASIIVAILGVETFYGQYTGKYPVLDSLVTLSFNYPPRATFFKKELEELLLLAREEQLELSLLKGSYAGALGTPQFISSSYRAYAVDFNQDGKRDLIHSVEDSIGSIANYFNRHGWKKGQPIALKTNPSNANIEALLSPLNNPKPKYALSKLNQLGIPSPNIGYDYQAALIALETEQGSDYYLGLNNFYVITRYNHSAHYAMAVNELSKDIMYRYQLLND